MGAHRITDQHASTRCAEQQRNHIGDDDACRHPCTTKEPVRQRGTQQREEHRTQQQRRGQAPTKSRKDVHVTNYGRARSRPPSTINVPSPFYYRNMAWPHRFHGSPDRTHYAPGVAVLAWDVDPAGLVPVTFRRTTFSFKTHHEEHLAWAIDLRPQSLLHWPGFQAIRSQRALIGHCWEPLRGSRFQTVHPPIGRKPSIPSSRDGVEGGVPLVL